MKIDQNWLNKITNLYKCPYCFKELSKSGICVHIMRTHLKDERFLNCGNKDFNKICWNKGLNKNNNKSLKQASEKLKINFKSGIQKPSFLGKKHSKETKEKISFSMIKFLNDNPEKVPYLLNHYSLKESYPEKYFRKIFELYKIKYEKEKRISIYSLDYVIGKIDFEINGEQHYNDLRIVKSDKRRYIYLKSIGYKIIKIRWSKYKKLSKTKRNYFINKIILKLKKELDTPILKKNEKGIKMF